MSQWIEGFITGMCCGTLLGAVGIIVIVWLSWRYELYRERKQAEMWRDLP